MTGKPGWEAMGMTFEGKVLDEYLFSQLVQKGNLGLVYLHGIREYRVPQPLVTPSISIY
jgi:hypothetical protein